MTTTTDFFGLDAVVGVTRSTARLAGSAAGSATVTGVPASNVISQSSAFDHALWLKTNCTVVPNVAGVADKMVESSDGISSVEHSLKWTDPHPDVAVFTVSVYAKPAGRTQVVLQFDEPGINVAPFTLVGPGAADPIRGNFTSSYIQYVGDGWYRCVATGVRTLGAPQRLAILTAVADAVSYPGDGVSGLLLRGAELIRGTVPTRNPYTFGATAGVSTVTGTTSFKLVATGTLTKTLDALTAAAVASTVMRASVSVTLNDTTFTGVAHALAAGTSTPTLGAVTLASTGTLRTSGTLTRTLADCLLSGDADALAIAVANTTLGALTLESAAGTVVTGALDATLDDATLEGLLTQPGSSFLNQILADVVLTSSGSNPVNIYCNEFLAPVVLTGEASAPATYTLTRTLGDVTLEALGDQYNHGELAQQLGDVALFAGGIRFTDDGTTRRGALYVQLDPVTTTTAGNVPQRATVAVTLGDTTLTGAVQAVALAMGVLNMLPATLVAVGTHATRGDLDVILDACLLTSVVDALAQGQATATFADTWAYGIGDVDTKGTSTSTLGPATLDGLGLVLVVGGVTTVLDDVTLVGDGIAYTLARVNVTLENLTTDITALALNNAVFDTTLEEVSLEGIGSAPSIGTLTQTLEDCILSGVVRAIVTGTLNGTLANSTVFSTGRVFVTGTFDRVLGILDEVAVGNAIVTGRLNTTLDGVVLAAAGHTPVTATLFYVFPDIVMEGKGLHVRRTPFLRAHVFVNYVIAHVTTTEIHAEVKADVIRAATVLEHEYEKKVA